MLFKNAAEGLSIMPINRQPPKTVQEYLRIKAIALL